MGTNGRFYGCESQGFPAVSNYDYDQNIPIRGIDNRSFTWEEVAVETIYLLKESTTSGDFENNLAYTALSITNYTGVNFITTGHTGRSDVYLGWTCSGSATVYIGQSGIFSNSLTGTTSNFQAHPLHGDNSIGLYTIPNDSPDACIFSQIMVTGEEGPMIHSHDHQLYMRAKTNYGGTGNLQVLVRGYNSNAIVAYYDHVSGSWTDVVPTGQFSIPTNVTEICYNFTTAVFPGSTPDSYDVIVKNVSTGVFITVDDIHIDAYMQQNAFVDYIVPTGYYIQVTPDLGWHNIMEMFDGTKEDFINPHLKTFGPFILENGNLTDNLDNTVTADIDYADFKSISIDNYTKYLWRAIPITPNGNIGNGGFPQKYNYIGNQLNQSLSIDPIVSNDAETIKIISGKKSKRMRILIDDQENFSGLSYPTDTTWKVEISLTVPSRTVRIQGVDLGGGTTSVIKVKLESKLYEQNTTALWNTFDEHGLVTDLIRLPSESNYDYSLRIKDAYKNRGGSSFKGIVNGATRELGLIKLDDAIKFEMNVDAFGNTFSDSATIETTSYSLRIGTPSMVVNERLLVDPVHNNIVLSNLPISDPEFIAIENNKVIGIPEVETQTIYDDSISIYTFKLKGTKYAGKFVTVKYNYVKEFLFKDYTTLGSLVEAINNFYEVGNILTVKATLSSRLSGNESCLGLYVSSYIIDKDNIGNTAWSPFYMKRISDRGYRDYYLRPNITLKDTEYNDIVNELKTSTKIFWGNVEADRSRWDATDSKDLAMDSIPTLFDPPLALFKSLYTGNDQRIESISAWGRGQIGFSAEFIENYGISSYFFQPGVAHTNDLAPSIYTTYSFIENTNIIDSTVGPERNNNNVIVFSGQR